jgi:hypothetical protein
VIGTSRKGWAHNALLTFAVICTTHWFAAQESFLKAPLESRLISTGFLGLLQGGLAGKAFFEHCRNYGLQN